MACCTGAEVDDGSGHDELVNGHEAVDDSSDPTLMFHSAPTLMFMAILFHDAFGSPRGHEHASVFQRLS